MVEAVRDIGRTVRDGIPPPPLPHSLRWKVSPNLMEARFRRYVKDFERHILPIFAGESDVMIAEDWLQRINRIFTIIGLKDNIHWWDITLISHPIMIMKWTDFERLFVGQYFLEAVHNEKRSECFTLKQADSIVKEYEMQFASLACFAAAPLTNDVSKATRFKVGLRPNI